MTAPIIEAQGLRTWFPVKSGVLQRVTGYLKAVDDVSLQVNSGEIVSVVGESGCGKSTLAGTLLGLIAPTGGKIFINGNPLDIHRARSWNPYRKTCQIIFQDPYSSLNPRLTAYEILSEALIVHRICTRKQARDKAAQLLVKVGLSPEYLDRFPHAFSGGQRQRLGIARVVGLNPHLIICDEIVSALDVSVQAQIIQLLLKLKEEMGLALLFIAHDLSLVKAISDRVHVMYLGKIVESAPAKALFARPKHPYTQSLLDSVPTRNRGRRPVALKGEVPSLSNLPKGCAFYGRCPRGRDDCRLNVPALSIAHESMAACLYPLGEDDA